MIRWMGQHATLQPVPGGAFEVDINGVPVRGHYLEIDPPRRVLIAWGVTGNPALPPGATQVEFTSPSPPPPPAPTCGSSAAACPCPRHPFTQRAGSTSSSGSPAPPPEETPAPTPGTAEAAQVAEVPALRRDLRAARAGLNAPVTDFCGAMADRSAGGSSAALEWRRVGTVLPEIAGDASHKHLVIQGLHARCRDATMSALRWLVPGATAPGGEGADDGCRTIRPGIQC
jgi:Activator of Hsp90 ATPase homolog 1-like protein